VVLHRPSKTAIHTRSKLACSQSRPTLARLEGAGALPATKATTEASPAEQTQSRAGKKITLHQINAAHAHPCAALNARAGTAWPSGPAIRANTGSTR